MWLLVGDSHVCTLEPFMGDDFTCEGFPGYNSEQALREFDWLIEPLVRDAARNGATGCILCFGANDVGALTPYETHDNLLQLQQRCQRQLPTCRVLGYPGIRERLDLPGYIHPIAVPRGADRVHMTAAGATKLADHIRKSIGCQ